MEQSLSFRFFTTVPRRWTPHPRAFRGAFVHLAHGMSQSLRTLSPGAQCACSAHSRAAQAHCGLASGRAQRRLPAGGRAPGLPGSEARAMEQRLAEFREARRRAGLSAEPGTSRQSAQTSGEKAEAIATPESALGWLKRFQVWKRRPASAPAQPSLAQVRGGRPGLGRGFWAIVVAPLETLAEAPPLPPRGGSQAPPP